MEMYIVAMYCINIRRMHLQLIHMEIKQQRNRIETTVRPTNLKNSKVWKMQSKQRGVSARACNKLPTYQNRFSAYLQKDECTNSYGFREYCRRYDMVLKVAKHPLSFLVCSVCSYLTSTIDNFYIVQSSYETQRLRNDRDALLSLFMNVYNYLQFRGCWSSIQNTMYHGLVLPINSLICQTTFSFTETTITRQTYFIMLGCLSSG